jgi:hypothetical protein
MAIVSPSMLIWLPSITSRLGNLIKNKLILTALSIQVPKFPIKNIILIYTLPGLHFEYIVTISGD